MIKNTGNEYKIKVKATGHGAWFGIFPFTREGLEVVRARTATEAVKKLHKEAKRLAIKEGLEDEDIEINILDVEKL